MDLVTIACEKYIDQSILQAESIQRFMEPCVHWVVINEENPNVDKWHNLLSKYYVNHELKLQVIDLSKYPWKIGQYTQQLCKYLIAKHCKTDYLLLDQKNFFIKQSTVNDWNTMVGCGLAHHYLPDNFWIPTIMQYSKELEVPFDSFQLATNTPFLINRVILDNYGLDNIVDDFIKASTNLTANEIMFYSMIARKTGFYSFTESTFVNHHKHSTKWWDTPTISEILSSENLPLIGGSLYHLAQKELSSVKILGFHRRYLEKLSELDFNILNDTLSLMGLEFKFDPNTYRS